MGRNIVILGALSAVAAAYARLRAAEGANLALVARDEVRLAALVHELSRAGAGRIVTEVADLTETAGAVDRLERLGHGIGSIDEIVLAYGTPGDQPACEREPERAAEVAVTNFGSVAVWLLAARRVLAGRRDASVVLLGSVAGDRGRRRNALYGACKAGLDTLAAGLRQQNDGPVITVIRLGPVDTPMTRGLPQAARLTVSCEVAARGIARAVRARRRVAYVPGWWRVVMLGVRGIPAPLFERLAF